MPPPGAGDGGAGLLSPRTAGCLSPPRLAGGKGSRNEKVGGAPEPKGFLPTRGKKKKKSLAQAKLFDHKRREAARTAELTRWGMWQ